eukprot:gene15291-18093_t
MAATRPPNEVCNIRSGELVFFLTFSLTILAAQYPAIGYSQEASPDSMRGDNEFPPPTTPTQAPSITPGHDDDGVLSSMANAFDEKATKRCCTDDCAYKDRNLVSMHSKCIPIEILERWRKSDPFSILIRSQFHSTKANMLAYADKNQHTLYFAVDKPITPYIKNNKVEGLPSLVNGEWPTLPHIVQQFVSFESRDEFLDFVNSKLGGNKNVMYEILREDRPCRMIADSDAILTRRRKDAGDTFTRDELCAALKLLTEWTFNDTESAVGDSDLPVEVRFVDGGCREKENGDTKLSVHMYVSGRALGHNKEHGEFVRACIMANALVMYHFLLENAEHPLVKFCNLHRDLGVVIRERYADLTSRISEGVESPTLAREEAWPWHPEHLHLMGESMSVKSILYQLAVGDDVAPEDDRVHEVVVRAIWLGARECIGDGLLDNMHTTDRVLRLVDHTKIFQNRPGRALEEVKTEECAFSSWKVVDMASIVDKGDLHKFTSTFDLDTAMEPLINFDRIPAFISWKSEAMHRHLIYGGRDANNALKSRSLAAASASAPRGRNESMSALRLNHPQLAGLLEAELADNVVWKKCLPTGTLKSVELPSPDFPNRLLVNTDEHECGWRGHHSNLPSGKDAGPAHSKNTVYFLLTEHHIRKKCTASWHDPYMGQNRFDIPYSSPERQTEMCEWLRRLKPTPTPPDTDNLSCFRNSSPSQDEIMHELDMELLEEPQECHEEFAEEPEALYNNNDEASGDHQDGDHDDDGNEERDGSVDASDGIIQEPPHHPRFHSQPEQAIVDFVDHVVLPEFLSDKVREDGLLTGPVIPNWQFQPKVKGILTPAMHQGDALLLPSAIQVAIEVVPHGGPKTRLFILKSDGYEEYMREDRRSICYTYVKNSLIQREVGGHIERSQADWNHLQIEEQKEEQDIDAEVVEESDLEDDGANDAKHFDLFTDLCVNKAKRSPQEQPYTMTVNKRKHADGTLFADEWMIAMTPCKEKRKKCNENGKFISTYYTTDNRILADTCHDPTCPHHAPQRMIPVANLDEYFASYLKANLVQNITNNVYNNDFSGSTINGDVNLHQQQAPAHLKKDGTHPAGIGTRWDERNANAFSKNLEGFVYKTKEFGLIMYDEATGLWVKEKNEHKRIMLNTKDRWAVATPTKNAGMGAIVSQTYSLVEWTAPNHAGFDDFGASQKGFLLFKNGVLDIRAGRMLPFDPKYRFMAAVPMSFDPLVDRSEMAKQVEEKIFTVESWIRTNYDVYDGDVYAAFGKRSRNAKGEDDWKWNWTAMHQAAGDGND